MSSVFRIHVIFFASFCCVQMHKLRSSHFQVSPAPGGTFAKQDVSILTTDVYDDFSCALLCSSTVECHYGLFDNDSKKCSLVKIKPNLYQGRTEEQESGKVLLEKVANLQNSKSDCASTEKDSKCAAHVLPPALFENGFLLVEFLILDGTPHCDRHLFKSLGQEINTPCGEIRRKNSSLASGDYDIAVGDVTWTTRCKMKGIYGCGAGAWTLVMSINGSKNTFMYDSHHWVTKASHQTFDGKQQESKLPGYWLSAFTKICIRMKIQQVRTNMLFKYTAKSLHSLLHEGIYKTLSGDASTTTPFIPPNVNTRCLVQGFNMLEPRPWQIKSRDGVQSMPLKCAPPYWVRGIGIGLQGYPKMNCGEIIYNVTKTTAHPASKCFVYIQ